MINYTQETINENHKLSVFIDAHLKEQDEESYQILLKQIKSHYFRVIKDKADFYKEKKNQANSNEVFLISAEDSLSNFSDLSEQAKIFYLEKKELSLFENPHLSQDNTAIKKIELNQLGNFNDELRRSYWDAIEEKRLKTRTQSFKNFKKLLRLEKNYSKYLQEKLTILKNKTHEVQVIEELNFFEEYCFQIKSKDELKVSLLNFWYEYTHSELVFLQPEQLEEVSACSYTIPVIINTEVEEYIGVKNPEVDGQKAFLLMHLFRIYLNTFIRRNLINRFEEEHQIWEDSFFKIKTPMALFNLKGDLIRHNAQFINLELMGKECLKLDHNQTININSKTYKVFKKEIDSHETANLFFVFVSNDYEQAKTLLAPSNEELGIVSSSIAHELNNPLAGILAALSVFELEDNLSDETISHLLEMKKGARRCRDLVQTFLGFSKIKPMDLKNTFKSSDKKLVVESFEQAFHLLRFRLIENNMKLNIDIKRIEAFEQPLNRSVLAMIFYLIMGEIITSFSHYLLISHEENKTLTGSMCERKDFIELLINHDFEHQSRITDSKLISHLISYLGLEIHLGKTIMIKSSTAPSLLKDVT